MKTLTLIGQKGGCGKSTLAVHLAVCAQRAGLAVAIIDMDPQASALRWQKRRQAYAQDAPGPEVIGAAGAALSGLLKLAKSNGVELLIIDTPPHTAAAAMAAASAATTILLPCRPSALDLDALVDTFAVLKLAPAVRKRTQFVLNAVPARGRSTDEIAQGLLEWAPVSPVRIGSRSAYSIAWNDGRSVQEYEPKGKASAEIKALFEWVLTL
jgi:chromosome partitioning protein